MKNENMIIQFMKQEGLEYDEPFIVKDKAYQREEMYQITIYGGELFLLRKSPSKGFVSFDKYEIKMYELMFTNKYEIKPLFKPKHKEYYYYVNLNEKIVKDIFSEHSLLAVVNYMIGNCFRSEQQALKYKDKILEVLSAKRRLLS